MADYDPYKRRYCRACGVPLTTRNLLDFGPHKINDFPETLTDLENVLRVPVQLVHCNHCELVQLRHTTPPDVLFRHFWYRSGITQTMDEELRSVVNDVGRRLKQPLWPRVLDIGCNDGTLLKNYPVSWDRVGYEPAQNIHVDDPDIRVVKDYYGSPEDPPQGPFDAITAIAMFYDLDDPNQFLRKVTMDLGPEGIFVVQMNYLESMLDRLAFDNVGHEHLEYYSLTAMERLLVRHHLYINDAQLRDINGGSIRIFISKHPGWTPEVERLMEKEAVSSYQMERRFLEFGARMAHIKHKVLKFMEIAKHQSRRIGICGASTRGNTLLQCFEIGPEQAVLAGERDERKWGRYTLTGIPIVSEDLMRQRADDLLVLPWHFQKEIQDREKEFIARGGRLIFPLPTPVVVDQFGAQELGD